MTKEIIIVNTHEVDIIPKLDIGALEDIYSSLSVKLQSITIIPEIEESVFEKALSISSEISTVFSGALDFAGLFKSKSASKEIEELNKLCKNSKASLGEYRKALETLDGALKAVGDSAFKAQGVTRNLEKKFKEIGNALGEGLIDGLKGQTLEITKTVEKLAKDTEGTFKETLVIRSPSKVFKQLGEYITEGLVDGIKEGSDDVTDTMRGLGDDMESSFGEKALSFGGGFALAAGVLGTIVEMFSNLMSTNEEFGAAVDEVWTQITEAFAPVTDAVMNLITSLGEEGMGGSFSWFSDALNGVSELAVSVIGTIGEFWAEHGEAIMLSVGEIWEFVSEILGGAIDFVGGVFEVISGIFSGNAEDIQSGMASLWEGIQEIFSPVVGFFTGIWERIKESFGTIGQTVADSISGAFKGTVNAIIRFAENTINGFIRSINKAIRLINEIPGVSVSLLSTISVPKLALGGMVMPGQLFIARESGPELVGSFGSRSAVMNNNQIVESVSRGVAMANMGEMALLREQNDLLRILINKKGSIAIGEREFGEVVVNALNRRTYELGDSGLRF